MVRWLSHLGKLSTPSGLGRRGRCSWAALGLCIVAALPLTSLVRVTARLHGLCHCPLAGIYGPYGTAQPRWWLLEI